MSPLAAADRGMVNKNHHGHIEHNAFDSLYQELEKGIKSMKSGEVYTLEEAWEEIDKI